MEDRWLSIAKRFLPQVVELRGRERTTGVADVICTLYAAPFTLIGLVWLIAVTDMAVVRTSWPMFLFLFGLLFVFQKFNFFLFIEVTPGTYVDWTWSLWSVVSWSAALLYGPTGLWIVVLWRFISFARQWPKATEADWRWNLVRNLLFSLMGVTVTALAALSFYRQWGGSFPLSGLSLAAILPALAATFVWLLLSTLIWSPLMAYYSGAEEYSWTRSAVLTFLRFIGITLGWRFLVDPFAILAAGLYAEHGLGIYLFFVLGLFLGSYLAHKLSQVVDRNHLRTLELERLERLGQALLDMPPDAATLPEILREHVSTMFPFCHIEIRVFPNQQVLHHPAESPAVSEAVWEWLRATPELRYFLPGALLPWGGRFDDRVVLVVPVMDADGGMAIGGIHLVRYRDPEVIVSVLPAVQSLASQIAGALHRTETYHQMVAHQQVEHELVLAGRIQKSFLPLDWPEVPGWQIVARLYPALQTSGDYYDVIPLPDGLLAVVVADVADKGVGAALYMALSRTLLRTFAQEYYDRPEMVMELTNRRILADTRAGLFVTAFYGILDPATGLLNYCNAGHNPPYFISACCENPVRVLVRTGMALGVLEDAVWQQRTVHFDPGDTLVLYTDGLTDAQNEAGEFWGQEPLLEVLEAYAPQGAEVLEEALITANRDFVGKALQFDDITLMVVGRDLTKDQSAFD
ncbi:MAG: PP2C family protein-serine/threonine phosphatase [Anaerolineae bacterium]|jgi:serine phosphatase RsbU (regulator of sigma subunit)|nr:PP2C family protein-serine/threonine phosphatase [Anaerolineae bacterium]